MFRNKTLILIFLLQTYKSHEITKNYLHKNILCYYMSNNSIFLY